MRKAFVIAGFVILTIIYVIVGAFLFLDIQSMEPPETTITVDVLEITTDEIVAQTTIEVYNPNSFDLITRDFKITMLSEDEEEIASIFIPGGVIPANDVGIFTETASVGFEGNGAGKITTVVSTKIGIKLLWFIDKTLPLNIAIVTNVGEAINDIDIPQVDVGLEFGEITEEGVNFTTVFDVYNPNLFEIYVKDIAVYIETETGEIVGSFIVEDGVVPPKESIALDGTGQLLIRMLNAKEVTISMNAVAGAKIAGIDKNISFSSDSSITMPDIEELLAVDDPTNLVIKADYRLTLRGFIVNVSIEFKNPNKVSLVLRNLSAFLYTVTDDVESLVGVETLAEGTVPPGSEMSLLYAEYIIPYRDIFFGFGNGGRGIPDWLIVTVQGELSLPGLNFGLYTAISGYQDLHPFR